MRRVLRTLSDHLLVALTLAFAAGIATAFSVPFDAPAVARLGLARIPLTLFLVGVNFLGGRMAMPALLPIAVFLFGLHHGLTHLLPPQDEAHLFHRMKTRTEAVVIGTLTAAAEFDGRNSRARIDSSHIRFADDPRLAPTTGTLLLRLPGPWPPSLTPGDTLALRATLQRPEGYLAPGAFDYPRHLALNGILVSAQVRSPLCIHKVEDRPGLLQRLRYLPELMRMHLGMAIDRAVDGQHRGLYRALLIGDASAIDDSTMESFKGSGTIHILSISGLHMTLVAAFLYAIFHWLLTRSPRVMARFSPRRGAAFLCLPGLLLYGLLAGMNIPVVRALVMSCTALVALCTDRQRSASTLLALAALVLLVIDPLSLALPSFQLSFAATAAILFLVPFLKTLVAGRSEEEGLSPLLRLRRWLLAALLVSAAATAATAPLTLAAFNRFAPVGLIANLVVEPLICLWSLPCGFLALPLLPVAPDLAATLLRLGGPGLTLAVQAATFFAELPGASLWRPSPPWWLLLPCGLGFSATLFASSLRPRLAALALALFLVPLAAMLLPPSLFPPQKPDAMRLVALDVGQGSATLIHYPSGRAVLIDGGGAATASPAVGERVIAPFLWSQGIATLDAIIITHPDADHYNGLGFVLHHFPTGALWVRDLHGHDEGYREVLKVAERRGVMLRVPEKGETLAGLGPGESLHCLASPAAGLVDAAASTDGGNNGLVVRACHRNGCALIPGDIDRDGEGRLLASGGDLAAKVLLSPHHGSKTSNSKEFLSAVAPQAMFVSAGRGNRGYFPHPGLNDDCLGLGIALFTTARHGTLTAEFTPTGVELAGYGRHVASPFLPCRLLPLTDKAFRVDSTPQ